MTRVLTLVLCFTFPVAASASCVRIDGQPDKRLCDLVTLEHLKADLIAAEHDRDVNAAKFAAANATITAKDTHISSLETSLKSPPFPWKETAVGAAVGFGAALLLFGVITVAK